MTDTAPLKGVCIGAGYFSPFHLEAWSRIPEVVVTALCDLDRPRAEAQARAYGVANCYSDFREMIAAEKPDFIDILSPPATHPEIVGFAARRDIPMICQKPLAPTMDACRQLVALTEAHDVPFMVHDNWRWQPWYREIKKIMDRGTIGAVSFAYFQMRMGDGWGEDAYLDRQPFFRDYARLLIYETGVHFIDTFRFLFGDIQSVYAQLYRLNPVIKGEDCGQVFFRFANGTRAIMDANRYNENESGMSLYRCDPRTTFGIMRLDGAAGHLIMDSCGDLTVKPLGRSSYRHEYDREHRGFAGDSVYNTFRHFVTNLHSGELFETNGREYLKTLEVVEACYRSAASGMPETIAGRPPADL
ncbi:MAG: Gfo/Idh/MocA family oxidoreductase [Desulfobacterales bacterium]|nr:Gfo/Idh/MocA family oxidoreductase [Desulfobacterales bacterium]